MSGYTKSSKVEIMSKEKNINGTNNIDRIRICDSNVSSILDSVRKELDELEVGFGAVNTDISARDEGQINERALLSKVRGHADSSARVLSKYLVALCMVLKKLDKQAGAENDK